MKKYHFKFNFLKKVIWKTENPENHTYSLIFVKINYITFIHKD